MASIAPTCCDAPAPQNPGLGRGTRRGVGTWDDGMSGKMSGKASLGAWRDQGICAITVTLW